MLNVDLQGPNVETGSYILEKVDLLNVIVFETIHSCKVLGLDDFIDDEKVEGIGGIDDDVLQVLKNALIVLIVNAICNFVWHLRHVLLDIVMVVYFSIVDRTERSDDEVVILYGLVKDNFINVRILEKNIYVVD